LKPQDTPQDNHQDNHQDGAQDDLEEAIIAYCFKPRSKKEIAGHFGYKDAKSFGDRYLRPLLTSGKILPTNPDKPTSRNQRYVSSSAGTDTETQ